MIMKERYKELLGKVYDLEGLLILASGRENIPAELSERIEQKIRELYESTATAVPAMQPPLIEEKEPEIPTELVNHDDEKEPGTGQLAEAQVELQNSDNTEDTEASETTEASEDKEASETTEEEPVKEHKKGFFKNTFSQRKSVLPPDTLAAVKEEFSLFYSLDEEEEKNDEEDTQDSEEEKERPQPAEQKPKREFKTENKGKRPVYSLNDRFLYTRELFKGDASAFNEAINKIPTFDNYEEAESYFTESLELDPERSETDKAFLKMIKAAFNKNYLC